MAGTPDYKFTEDELRWLAQHVDDAEGWTREDTILRRALMVTFLFGLVVHLIGFAIASGAMGTDGGWPASLAADLLANFGVALWTAAVIVLFLEVWPRATLRRNQRFYRSALVALRERGYRVPPQPAEIEDPVQAKLDAILTRVGSIEAAVKPPAPPGAQST